MRIPKPLRHVDRNGAVVSTFEYADESVIAVDFGHEIDDLAVDVIGETVIVVMDDDQFEFELPPEASDVSARNGVLTIEE